MYPEKGKKNNIQTNTDISQMMFGKVPPQSKIAEEDLLGKILQFGNEAMDRVTDVLDNPFAFYVEAHQRIFRAMLTLRSKSIQPDVVSVVEELKRTEELDLVGGAFYITGLTKKIVVSANIEHMAKLVDDKFTARELIRIGGEVVGNAYEDKADPHELLDQVEKSLYNLSFKNKHAGYIPISAASIKAIERMVFLRSLKIEIHGVPSGFISLDKLTGGWQNTDLIILAARPGAGKTAAALNLARNAAGKDIPVLFFSLEMSTMQCTQRLASSESGVPIDKILRPYKLEEHELKTLYEKGYEVISDLPLYIDDTPAQTIYQIRAKARAFFRQHLAHLPEQERKGLIILDYLQLMAGIENRRADNREQEISKITRDLKGLAKELNLPLIALSQLSRKVEDRKEGKKIPQLSDLRESGAIEQDADMVIFIYRPEYYDIHVKENGQNNNGETHFKIAKHRSGALDTIKLRANLSIQKFTDIEDDKSQVVQMEDPFPIDRSQMQIQLGSKMSLDNIDEYDFTKD